MSHILVTASSRHGATEEIAAHLTEALLAHGHQVDHLPPEQVTTPQGYDALVVGGSVHAGSWPKAGVHLVDRLTTAESLPPTWVFSSGPVGNPPAPAEVPKFAQEQADRLSAVEHRVFPGRIDRTLLSLPERMILRALKITDGDYRSWPEITAWAEQITATLAEQHTVE